MSEEVGINMQRVTVGVGGMTCNHCVLAVTKALKDLSGVGEVKVDLAGGKAEIEYEPGTVSFDAFAKAIAEEGYQYRGPVAS